MTAPMLSPAEQREVSRFGVHDEDVIADMEDHMDDVVACCVSECDTAASLVLKARCCPASANFCAGHYALKRVNWRSVWTVVCAHCEHAFVVFPTFDEVFTAVPL